MSDIYTLLMERDAPALDEALELLIGNGKIERYHRFKTGHYAVWPIEEDVREELSSLPGVESVVLSPVYSTTAASEGYLSQMHQDAPQNPAGSLLPPSQ